MEQWKSQRGSDNSFRCTLSTAVRSSDLHLLQKYVKEHGASMSEVIRMAIYNMLYQNV